MSYYYRARELIKAVEIFRNSGGEVEWLQEKYMWFFKRKVMRFSKNGKHLYTVPQKCTYDYGFQGVLIRQLKIWSQQ